MGANTSRKGDEVKHFALFVIKPPRNGKEYVRLMYVEKPSEALLISGERLLAYVVIDRQFSAGEKKILKKVVEVGQPVSDLLTRVYHEPQFCEVYELLSEIDAATAPLAKRSDTNFHLLLQVCELSGYTRST